MCADRQSNSPEDQAARHHDEAIGLASTGHLAEAIPHFERARQLQPTNAVWHFNAALALQQINRLPEAIHAYHQAIGIAPDFFDAWSNLCVALKSGDQIAAAIQAGHRAIELRPQSAAAHLNLGNALKAAGQWRDAETAYRHAVALDPDNPRNQLNLANALREEGRLDQALPLFRQTVAQHPQFAEAHRDLAFALFLSGDFLSGWVENEWRWQTQDMAQKKRSFPQPEWAGEDLQGKTILIYAEQGFGDAIQFARFVEWIGCRGARVFLECQAGLSKLFTTLRGVDQLLLRGDALPPFDYQCALLSLPRILGITLQSIPARGPYLTAPSSGFKFQIPPYSEKTLKIGLTWAGNPGHRNDRNRSMRLEDLKPLFEIPGVTLFSLQVGERSSDWQQNAPQGSPQMNLGPHLRDYADTSAVIQCLDLVISVDTSIAHLSGALGKPTWLLLPFAPDWRWLLQREDSPWYPTMWLVRQPNPGNWAAVVDRVARRIRGMLS